MDLVCSTGQSPEPERAEDEHDHPDRGCAGWGRFGANVPSLCAGEQHPGLQTPHLPSQPAWADRSCKSSGIFPSFIWLPVVFSCGHTWELELKGHLCLMLCFMCQERGNQGKKWWWNSSLDPMPMAESCRNLLNFGIAFPDLSTFGSQNIAKKHFWEETWRYSFEGFYKPLLGRGSISHWLLKGFLLLLSVLIKRHWRAFGVYPM